MSTPERPLPARPTNVYKAIIDALVNDVRPTGHARFVKDTAIFSAADPEKNAFVDSLTAEQRTRLCDLLLAERDDAIHDTLALLWWWISCHDVALTCRGEPLPLDQFDFGLHGDYINRIQGNDWPRGTAEDEAELAAIGAAEQNARRQQAEKDAAVTDRRCPHCGAPCPSYRKTCKACGKPQGA